MPNTENVAGKVVVPLKLIEREALNAVTRELSALEVETKQRRQTLTDRVKAIVVEIASDHSIAPPAGPWRALTKDGSLVALEWEAAHAPSEEECPSCP